MTCGKRLGGPRTPSARCQTCDPHVPLLANFRSTVERDADRQSHLAHHAAAVPFGALPFAWISIRQALGVAMRCALADQRGGHIQPRAFLTGTGRRNRSEAKPAGSGAVSRPALAWTAATATGGIEPPGRRRGPAGRAMRQALPRVFRHRPARRQPHGRDGARQAGPDKGRRPRRAAGASLAAGRPRPASWPWGSHGLRDTVKERCVRREDSAQACLGGLALGRDLAARLSAVHASTPICSLAYSATLSFHHSSSTLAL